MSYVVLINHTWQDVYKEMLDQGLVQLFLNEIPDSETLMELGNEHKETGGG